jgi:hypothetical protein
MSDNLKPSHRVITAFGGQSALARALGLKQSTVWGWADSGTIPARRIPEVIAAGARSQPPVILTPSDFFDLTSLDILCADNPVDGGVNNDLYPKAVSPGDLAS